jgi:hypothetical protein
MFLGKTKRGKKKWENVEEKEERRQKKGKVKLKG